jgi:tRNA(Ile)-lysidine synthase
VKRTAHPRDAELAWPAPFATLTLPQGLGSLSLLLGGELRAPTVDEAVSVRFQASGLIHIVGRHGGRKLKKIWQELGIPPWQRDATPLLFYGDTLIAAADRFVTREGVKEAGQTGVRLAWQR